MESNAAVLTGEHFITGNEACAEGALAAGCRFFAGYPITPSTEVAEHLSKRLPQVGGTFIQMEDELASMNAILGASWAGMKTMTATSGPGFSLMMENLGLGVMLETPCVLVNIQRGGPSTGLPTLVGQGDMMQARWGSHGPYEIIALSPSSPQEIFDFTIKAFNLSEQFRVPTLVMSDEVVGHMTEKVTVPAPEDIKLTYRKTPKVPPEEYLPYEADEDLVPAMALAGQGYGMHVTGLTHDRKGYPVISEEAQIELVERLVYKIRKNRDKIIEYREEECEGADVIVCAYGISARTCLLPIGMAREEGIKVGLLKLIVVWPFPEEHIDQLAEGVKGFVVPEINYGQISLEVERCAHGKAKVIHVPHAGGGIHDPTKVLEAIRRAAK
ncbi:MAG: 2-oxoglutarate ferredoxin oxidoreductase subunit alpha [Latescibacteria bacterium DG_63]|nr:MAG: 2-oxoglutarate ferredoxin oxidoreductase subunit alpha [Latescibacteria bacterium DG_63]